ncbi:hypothetical protein AMEX_G6730 [Astyanax mexicanus]|uniref:Uncharacterized protein n=1 Tax=Astyanax mexicanus TaxID=7994 RepID=A0A8T2M432_ASTMX|nr:hypothetical protein AMEX_G6730 [Astyanax mexicanus]
MRIEKCVILSFILMVCPPPCSPSPILQQNPTPLPAMNTVCLSDVSVERCGDPESSTKVQQVQTRPRGFPGGRAPLDPLSVSPAKPKRGDRPRRIKPSQKRQRTSSPLDQARVNQSGSFPPVRPVDSGSSAGQAEKNTSSNQQKPEPTKASEITERSPPDHSRSRLLRGSSRTGFGLPLDRVGLGRLPSGRRSF